MSITPTYAIAKDAHKAGWFSRRHRTSEAHIAAKNKREAKEVAKKARGKNV